MRVEDVTKLLSPLRTRVANMVARAVVRVVNDAAKIQALQVSVLDGETREGLERFQQYGFTSVPDVGAEAVVLFVGGRRDHGIVVAVDDRRYRLKSLQPGEVALYAKSGQSITLKQDGTTEVGGGTMQAAALGQDVRDELDALWSALQGHTHTVSTSGSDPQGGAVASTGTAAAPSVTKQAKTVKSASVKVQT